WVVTFISCGTLIWQFGGCLGFFDASGRLGGRRALAKRLSQEASRCGTRIGTQYTLALMPVHALWLSEGLGYSWKAKRRGLKT
ncbi:MAG: hypothetical protein NWQ61_11045, partial [OM182 bacterium]|nr:hypothetical protein [OM182 bacterium]